MSYRAFGASTSGRLGGSRRDRTDTLAARCVDGTWTGRSVGRPEGLDSEHPKGGRSFINLVEHSFDDLTRASLETLRSIQLSRRSGQRAVHTTLHTTWAYRAGRSSTPPYRKPREK